MTLTAAGAILESQLGVAPEVVVEFVALYSSLEFALKRAGYARPAQEPGEFKLEWEQFEAELAPGFLPDSSPELAQAVDYLCDRPPMKEVWSGTQVEWKEVSAGGSRSLSSVLAHVRRARNNLFHGGKFATAPKDPARNHEVLSAGLTVLDEVVRLSEARAPQVYGAFSSPNY